MSDDEEDDEISICSFCGDKTSRNTNLKLLITPCGHTICGPCTGSSFRQSKNVDCKGCASAGIAVLNFRRDELVPTDDFDPFVRREIKVRHEVLRVYNRQESDFEDRKEYIKYLDKVENIIHSLVNRIDEQQIRDEMEQYQQSNKDVIYRNQQKKKERESNFGRKPLKWQIVPAPNVWYKSPKRTPEPAPALPLPHAPPAAAMMPQQAPRPAPPPQNAQPLVKRVSDKDEDKDSAAAKRAGGFQDTYRALRDSNAALFGLRAALRARIA